MNDDKRIALREFETHVLLAILFRVQNGEDVQDAAIREQARLLYGRIEPQIMRASS